jgi:hypothetical protein
LTEIEENDGPSIGSRNFTSKIDPKTLIEDEENISMTDSNTELHNNSIERFNILNIGIKDSYFS